MSVSKLNLAKGVGWLWGNQLITKGLSLLRMLVVARFLLPEDFGLFGIASLVLLITNSTSQVGFDVSLIQKKDVVQNELNNAWTVVLIRGFVLSFLVYFSTPMVSSIFNEPRVEPILRVMALIPILDSFKNYSILLLDKNLEFKRKAFYELAISLITFMATVIPAMLYNSLWALVFGQFCQSIGTLVLSYIICPYRQKLALNFQIVRRLFQFGKWVTGSNIVILISTKLDDFISGKYLGAGALGVYQMAYLIANIPVTELSLVINKALFPLLCKLKDNNSKFRSSFVVALRTASMIGPGLTIGIYIFIPELVRFVLGAHWGSIIEPVRILLLATMVRQYSVFFGSLYFAIAKPKLVFLKNILKVIGMICVLALLWDDLNIESMALASLCGTVVAGIFDLIMLGYLKKYQIQLNDIMHSVLPETISAMILGVLFFAGVGTNVFDQLHLALIGMAVYVLLYCGLIGGNYFIFGRKQEDHPINVFLKMYQH